MLLAERLNGERPEPHYIMSKGSRDRTDNFREYWRNVAQIDWRRKKIYDHEKGVADMDDYIKQLVPKEQSGPQWYNR